MFLSFYEGTSATTPDGPVQVSGLLSRRIQIPRGDGYPIHQISRMLARIILVHSVTPSELHEIPERCRLWNSQRHHASGAHHLVGNRVSDCCVSFFSRSSRLMDTQEEEKPPI